MKRDRWIFVFSVLLVFFVGILFSRFLAWNELRPGLVFVDPIFAYYTAKDFSYLISFFTYGSLFLFLFSYAKNLSLLSCFVFAYTGVLLLRFITLFFFPLYVDPWSLYLHDVFLDTFVYAFGGIQRDLFFSGHVALLSLFLFFSKTPWLRYIFTAVTLLVAAMLLLQKVHFSIDILFAPFFAFLAYYFGLFIYSVFEKVADTYLASFHSKES